MRIALLGGSFNPPHVGHLMNAYWVLATCEIDRLWLVPVFRHPFGKPLAPFDDRVRMCELAAQPFGGRIEVSRAEEQLPPGSKTVDLLEELVKRHPEHRFALVIGSDILPERPKWKRFDRIEQLAEVIVVPRAGYPAPGVSGPALPAVSSSDVRERLAHGDEVSGHVPRAVLAYARERRLYGLPSRA